MSCDNCNCGENGNCSEDDQHEFETVTISFNDNEEEEFIILGVFPVDDKEYIALLPTENSDEALVLRYIEKEDGFDVEEIEDDDEYEKVEQVFTELFGEDEECSE